MLFKRSPSPNPPVNVSSKRRSGWVKLTVAGLSAALIIGSLVAWRASSAKKEDKKPVEVTLEFAPADITVVEQKALTRTLPFSGSLSPLVQSTVKSKVSGEVQKVLVREGETVKQGQVLALIDTADLNARLDAQVATLEEAKARWSIADKNRDSNLKLLKIGRAHV